MKFPAREWEQISPVDAGFDAKQLSAAIAFGEDKEIGIGEDLSVMLPDGSRHPCDCPLGPLKSRGGVSGMVVRDGSLVTSFGDCARPEVTFSVSKSYLSVLAGIAVREQLISPSDPVAETVRDGGFDSAHNAQITWQQLWQQTSEWEGELFGLPDWIDRGRQVTGVAAGRESTVGGSAASAGNSYRDLSSPGSFWEYNDVRVNRTSLALLRVFGEPLPDVLRREVMGPMDASESWTWHGYRTSWVELDGRDVQSVSGGAHWGGGLWINTSDHARFGLLCMNKGAWNGRQLLPETWMAESLSPCPLNPAYGYLWWLNTDNGISRVADVTAFAARGAGGHIIFVWPEASIVIVLRWCSDPGAVIDAILTARR